ncbi:MAG: alanine--glyoxylate aminotransferase family protein [Leptospiraceae bacterium]|nr:alanine--glyoxylate aminotransferase family protein [Leptospiraceae bacterium]
MINNPSFNKISTTEKLLLGPGPSNIHPETSLAMAKPILGHLDPDFLKIMDENQEMLRYVFQTKNKLTLPVSATGSAGMETCIVNLIDPGDKILIAINGVFGNRMKDVATRVGAEVHIIEKPWGEVFSYEELEDALSKIKPKVLGIVHAETSTGASQPLEKLGKIAHKYNSLLLVDCVTSLGGSKLLIDEWEIDAAYSGTQKCLSCPPGLSPVTFSQRAEKVIDVKKTKVQSWYLDLSMVKSYFGNERVYHHTAPINMNYALHESLRQVCEEGLVKRWERHILSHKSLKAGLESMNIKFVVDDAYRLPQLNTVFIPEKINDGNVRKRLLEIHKIEMGGGLGIFKGKAWRIGLMGHSAYPHNVYRFLVALKDCLIQEGMKIDVDPVYFASKSVS